MLDPPTHNRPFADKRDKVGMDGIPKSIIDPKSQTSTFSMPIPRELGLPKTFSTKIGFLNSISRIAGRRLLFNPL